jgi:ABC-type transport system involved in multi-copper enzyme maturation permease subunit
MKVSPGSPSRRSPPVTVARYTLIEALRSGLPWLATGCVVAVLGLSGFLSQVAITESTALQASTSGALLRACAVFLIAAHVVASVSREANDKGLELVLALPISRPAYYLGKLLGFAAAGALLTTLFALPLLLWAKPVDLVAWAISLAAETAVVAAAALFFASAMTQTVAAIAAVTGLYLLGRSISAIQAIAGGPLAGDSLPSHAARWIVDALALMLPRLDAVTRGDWLLYGAPPAGELTQSLFGLGLYLVLLVAAGLFDFSRRNL